MTRSSSARTPSARSTAARATAARATAARATAACPPSAHRQPPPEEAGPDLDQPWPLLGGLTPVQFMRRHWQRRPLLIRQAWPGVQPPADRAGLFELASREDVESRCIEHRQGHWKLRHGPLTRRALPPLSRPGWTLLVQGLDLHVDAAHAMLRAFAFLPQARVDDLMVSYASDGGGVGPHVDSYDVFLLQVQGRRRWRIAPPGDATFRAGVPLRILERFEPTQEWVLEPGDMLYLPPGWGHDGIAQGGDCMTASIGFRAPTHGELLAAMLTRAADEVAEQAEDAERRNPWRRRLTDAGQAATPTPAAMPASLQTLAHDLVARMRDDPGLWQRALGGWVTEPKPQVWFEPCEPHALQALAAGAGVKLDRRSRIAYDAHHLFLNGEGWRIGGRDAQVLRRLADRGSLSGAQCRRLGADAQQALQAWVEQGWLRVL